MKKNDVDKKTPAAGQSVDQAMKNKKNLGPCDKAFHPETARLEDKDDACDDGVR